MIKNEINVYYKGVKQKIKYYGKFNDISIKKTIKQIFKINESIEQIYFQDEDGDILALNEDTPSGISVYLLNQMLFLKIHQKKFQSQKQMKN